MGVCVGVDGALSMITEFLPKGSVYMWLRHGCVRLVALETTRPPRAT